MSGVITIKRKTGTTPAGHGFVCVLIFVDGVQQAGVSYSDEDDWQRIEAEKIIESLRTSLATHRRAEPLA